MTIQCTHLVTYQMRALKKSNRVISAVGRHTRGLTADVQSALVADANRVAVVVHAVGAYLLFRTAWLYLSVTTDDVVVADALKLSVLMPLIYLLCR